MREQLFLRCFVRVVLFVLLTGVCQALATELFMINKTGKLIYYEISYFSLGQTVLKPFVPSTKDKTVKDYFDRLLQEKVQFGKLEKDQSIRIKSYRLQSIRLKPKEKGRSLITSFAGDQRILRKCRHVKWSICRGNVLKNIRRSEVKLRGGDLIIRQQPLERVVKPVVLAITNDPKEKTGYILTELAHKWGLHKPKIFFYQLKNMPTPQ